jgi:hypothetical protein
MAKTVKMSKMASKDDPHPTVLGTEGSIHINLDQEITTANQSGMKVFKGTHCYRQVKLVEATEMDLAVAKERVKMLEYKIELINHKLEVALAHSECWKCKYRWMLDPSDGPMDYSKNSSQNSVKIAAHHT